jgi:hypothetical protein
MQLPALLGPLRKSNISDSAAQDSSSGTASEDTLRMSGMDGRDDEMAKTLTVETRACDQAIPSNSKQLGSK